MSRQGLYASCTRTKRRAWTSSFGLTAGSWTQHTSQWVEMLEAGSAHGGVDADAAVLPYCAQLILWHRHNIIVSSDLTRYTIYHNVALLVPEARVPPSVALGLMYELLYTAPVVNLDLWMHMYIGDLCTAAPGLDGF
ncbi:hypothetical protein GGX14DRAFT_386975 [Mycena pura]|uniref:Uncharacterized protein n=1 Tax=Mycena pura TaxID=153505 RepID=A0AAD6YMT5_9AGAR|nr:hypothetical protein GGX14DRAFT_386975 [Mycena pura]